MRIWRHRVVAPWHYIPPARGGRRQRRAQFAGPRHPSPHHQSLGTCSSAPLQSRRRPLRLLLRRLRRSASLLSQGFALLRTLLATPLFMVCFTISPLRSAPAAADKRCHRNQSVARGVRRRLAARTDGTPTGFRGRSSWAHQTPKSPTNYRLVSIKATALHSKKQVADPLATQIFTKMLKHSPFYLHHYVRNGAPLNVTKQSLLSYMQGYLSKAVRPCNFSIVK